MLTLRRSSRVFACGFALALTYTGALACGGPSSSTGSGVGPAPSPGLDAFAAATPEVDGGAQLTDAANADQASDPGDTVETGDITPDLGPPEPVPREIPPPTWSDAPGRVVALGDFHGDYWSAVGALQVAGVGDADGAWIGGDTVLVQVGDQLDRGDGERAIIHLLEALADDAHAAGGAVHILNGNHEVMNVELDLRYVTPGGYEDFADIPYDPADPLISTYPEEERGRVAAFRPGGPYAEILAGHNVAVMVDDTVFVHGGVLPEAAYYGLDAANAETRAWMLGEASQPDILGDLVWTRIYSNDDDAPPDCVTLQETLDILGAARMVVAHTVQDFGISSACGGAVWRIDVGISSYYGGSAEALEILGDEVRVLQ